MEQKWLNGQEFKKYETTKNLIEYYRNLTKLVVDMEENILHEAVRMIICYLYKQLTKCTTYQQDEVLVIYLGG